MDKHIFPLPQKEKMPKFLNSHQWIRRLVSRKREWGKRNREEVRQKTQIITIIQNLKGTNVSNKTAKLRAEGAVQRQSTCPGGWGSVFDP